MPPLSTEIGSAQENKQTRRYQEFHVRAECRKKARNGHGSDYRTRSRELSILQDESFGPHSSDWRALPSPISMRRAKDHLCREPDLTDPRVSSALARIKEIISSDTPVMWDLVIKMFDDLDLVYFHGHLGYCVLLQWAGFGETPAIFAADRLLSNIGLTVPPNTYPNDQPRVRIYLRCDFKWQTLPRLFPLGCLVHEMLHAWFIIWCGKEGARESEAEDPSHGPLFGEAAKWLEERSGLDLLSSWYRVAKQMRREDRK